MEEVDLGWHGCFDWLKRTSRTWRRFLVAQWFYQLERSIVYLQAADLKSRSFSTGSSAAARSWRYQTWRQLRK
jgi:hypothetical protein